MKLEKETLAAVTSHILEQIKKKYSISVTKEEKKLIKTFLSDNAERIKCIKELEAERVVIQAKFNKAISLSARYYALTQASIEAEVLKGKFSKLPTAAEIRQEVILKSLFSNEKELATFIKELVAKY